jgi:hypothetical protein
MLLTMSGRTDKRFHSSVLYLLAVAELCDNSVSVM